jgi:hypothetical protein
VVSDPLIVDHQRSIDKRRIRRVFGDLAREEIAAIDEGPLKIQIGGSSSIIALRPACSNGGPCLAPP